MKSKLHKVTWQTRAGGLLVLLGFVPAFSFYAGMQFQSLVDTSRTVENLSAQNEMLAPAPGISKAATANTSASGHQVVPELPESASYVSPKQTYAVSLFKLPGENRCVFTVSTNLGNSIDITALIGASSIPCQVTTTGLSGGFHQWLDENTFEINVGGKILQINVAEKTVKTR